MDKTDKKEILGAFGSLVTHVDGRFDQLDARMNGIEARMSGMEGRMESLTKEMRTRFDDVDRRLDAVEENGKATSAAFDTLLEGDELGNDHIMLTRPEYNSLMEVAHLPNRFGTRAR